MSFISESLGNLFVEVIGAEYLGNDDIIKGLAPHLDHKIEQFHTHLLKQYAEIRGITVTELLERHRIRPQETASYKEQIVYDDFTDDYEIVLEEFPNAEKGVESFKIVEAYRLQKGFQACGEEGSELLSHLQSESKYPDSKKNSSETLQQVKFIRSQLKSCQKKLELLNQYVFITKLPGGNTFLEDIGSTLLERLEYIKRHPDKVAHWITSSPTLQECEELNLSCLENFTVPAWISLLPNLKVLDLSFTNTVSFKDNFNPQNLEKLVLIGARNPYFGNTFNPQNLKVLDLTEAEEVLFNHSFNPENLEELHLRSTSLIMFGAAFNPQNLTWIDLKDSEDIDFPNGAPPVWI